MLYVRVEQLVIQARTDLYPALWPGGRHRFSLRCILAMAERLQEQKRAWALTEKARQEHSIEDTVGAKPISEREVAFVKAKE